MYADKIFMKITSPSPRQSIHLFHFFLRAELSNSSQKKINNINLSRHLLHFYNSDVEIVDFDNYIEMYIYLNSIHRLF